MQKNFFIGLALIVIIVAGGYAAFRAMPASTPAGEEATTTPSTTITGGGYTIEQVSSDDIRSMMPSLTRPVVYGGSVTPEVRAQVEKRVTELTANLEKDPTQVADWLQLGVMHHAVSDYEGAENIWLFLEKVLPNDTTALDNLGKLYHFDLKDFPKAEQYFKKSIAVAPTSAIPYIELYTLYRYSYKKDTSAAADILRAWTKALPESPDPWLTLGVYYHDIGKIADARTALTTAMDIARTTGNVDLMSRIRSELSKLEP